MGAAISFCNAKDLIQDLPYLINTEQWMETLCFKNRHPELKNNLQGRPNKSTTLRDAISFCAAKDLIQDLQYLINTEQRMEILCFNNRHPELKKGVHIKDYQMKEVGRRYQLLCCEGSHSGFTVLN